MWGHNVDLSAHIFRTQDIFVADLWREFAGETVAVELRRAIFDGHATIDYPLTPTRIARQLSANDLLRGIGGFVFNRASPRSIDTAVDAQTWMTRRYGKRFYQLFFRDYAEKLWGQPSAEIDARFAHYLFDSASSSRSGDQQFDHPPDGVGSVWARLADHLVAVGVRLRLNTAVDDLSIEGRRVDGITVGGEHHQFDHVVSTMPVGHLARLAFPGDSEVRRLGSLLQSRSSILVYLQVTRQQRCQWNWISVYPPEYLVGRVTDFSNWTEHDADTTVLCLEYWCDKNDGLWRSRDSELATLATDELSRLGLFGDLEVLDSHIERVANSHPSYSLGTADVLLNLDKRLAGLVGCTTIGRGGSHSVLGMGQSMEAARLIADQILG